MKTLMLFLSLTATSAAALPGEELHRLGAYLAYAVSAVKADGGGNTPDKPVAPAGGVCSECNGVGRLGDGVVMFTCGHCNGTGREPGASSAPEGSPETPQPTEEVLEQVAPEVKPQEVSSPSINDLGGSRWNWQGKGSVPLSEMRRHLISEHSVEKASVSKMSKTEIEALHNLLHNSEVRSAPPKAKSKSSSSCPSGNCPTSSSSSSRSRYRLFRR